MRKTFRKLVIAFLVITLSFALASTTLASGDPGLHGKNYVKNTESLYKVTTWEHDATNPSSTADSVSHSVSRTKSFTGTLSGSAEINAVLAKTTVTAEVSYGQSYTSSTTCTYSIPPYSSWTLQYGSKFDKTTGTMENWNYGTLQSSKSVNAKYTYKSWSGKVQIN